jgi:uncharacterized protein
VKILPAAAVLSILLPLSAVAETAPPPIIDVHLHALPADFFGPPRRAFCLPTVQWPAHDPRRPYGETLREWEENPTAVVPHCDAPVWSPETDDELMRETLEILERRNIVGVTSGPRVGAWQKQAEDRVIPGLMFSVGHEPPPVETVRKWLEEGRYQVLAEVTNQYHGIAPDDPRFEPYLALAEELDVPVGIHVGPGPPGIAYAGAPAYRGRLHSPLLLEEVLLRHPNLRLYVMHAGWPMIDDLLALMWAHPQVYAGVGIISYALPRAGFHSYLRRIVEAGFGNRVMFGSDQMIWPEALEVAIESIETADFLSEQQKRDILYNNAARFFRLEETAAAP